MRYRWHNTNHEGKIGSQFPLYWLLMRIWWSDGKTNMGSVTNKERDRHSSLLHYSRLLYSTTLLQNNMQKVLAVIKQESCIINKLFLWSFFLSLSPNFNIKQGWIGKYYQLNIIFICRGCNLLIVSFFNSTQNRI